MLNDFFNIHDYITMAQLSLSFKLTSVAQLYYSFNTTTWLWMRSLLVAVGYQTDMNTNKKNS